MLVNVRRFCAVMAIILAVYAFSGCAVVSLDDGSIIFGGKAADEAESASVFEAEFDPDEYVASIWESQALPTILDSAADLAEVREAIAQDFEKACENYGILSNDKGTWVFVVKGEGTVREVNRESRNGIAAVEANGADISIQIGPVYKGASLRDALPFIKFSDFKNQVAFSGISSALNRYVDTNIVPASGIDQAAGKTLSFTGVFSIKNAQDDIIITPVELQIGA